MIANILQYQYQLVFLMSMLRYAVFFYLYDNPTLTLTHANTFEPL